MSVQERRVGLKLRNTLTLFFVIYIIALSFIPLLHDTLLAQGKWLGYGTGAYQYQSQSYFVLFNDPYDGSSKPHIHVNPSFAPASRISLIEFSDWTSWVNGYNLFNDFNVTMRASPQTLDITYSGPELVLHKYIEMSPDAVKVIMQSEKEFTAHVEMWRWVMTSINGISIKDVAKPLVIAPTTLLEFTFSDDSLPGLGHGRIVMSAMPSQIEIWPFEKGFNKITVDFVNSMMSFTVSGSMEAVGTPSLEWNYSLLSYVLPIVSVTVVALYLLVGRYGRTIKNRAASRGN
jgi:hypothetical protein